MNLILYFIENEIESLIIKFKKYISMTQQIVEKKIKRNSIKKTKKNIKCENLNALRGNK